MEDSLRRGLIEMEKRRYSLVRFRGTWSFTLNNEPPDDPPITFSLVSSGDVIRLGHWTTPLEAIISLGKGT